MGRNLKLTVEYYPHFIGDGKKMFTLQVKHGNDGYAVWNKILELLAKTANHYLDLSVKSELMFVASYCLVTEEKLIEIMNDICDLEEIDSELWKSRIVWNQRFIDSIQFAYAKRSNPCINRHGLIQILTSKGKVSKIEEKPLKKIVEKKKPESSSEFDFEKSLIAAGAKPETVSVWLSIRKKKRGVNSQIAFDGFIREVEKSGHNIQDVILKCVERSWVSFESEWIKVKPSFNGSGKTTHNNSGDNTNWENELAQAHGS